MTDAGTGDGSANAGSDEERTYRGLPSAFPYAFRASESRLFKTYVLVGGLAALFVVLAFTAALVNLMGDTASAQGGTFTFSRTFFVFLMVLVFAPLVAPILLVARHHRRVGPNRTYERALAAGGYLFFVGMYVSLAVSVPPALREESPGALGAFLYSLPTVTAAVPPLVAVVAIYLAHRRYR